MLRLCSVAKVARSTTAGVRASGLLQHRGVRVWSAVQQQQQAFIEGQHKARPSRLSEALKAWVSDEQGIEPVRAKAVVTVHCSFNNTIVTGSKLNGDVITTRSGGTEGFRKSQRSTSQAAYAAGNAVGEAMHQQGFKSAKVHIKGPTRNRQSALRGVVDAQVQISEIKDITPLPFNGCRPPKARRR